MLPLINWLTPWARTFTVRHGRARFRFPHSRTPDLILRRMARSGRFYERDLLRALERRLGGARGWAVDCGANVGNHAVFFAGVLGLHTCAFEPIARNRALLTQAAELNGLGHRLHIEPTALGDAPGQLHLACHDLQNPGSFGAIEAASSEQLARAGAAAVPRESPLAKAVQTVAAVQTAEAVQTVATAPVLPLDTWFAERGAARVAESGPLRVVKVDVEGFEPQVLAGARALLTREQPLVCSECTSRAEYQELVGVLEPLGYAPTGVFCATPTILFERGAAAGPGAAAVAARLADFERDGYG